MTDVTQLLLLLIEPLKGEIFSMKSSMPRNKFLKLFIITVFVQIYFWSNLVGQFTDTEFEKMATEMAKGEITDIDVTTLKGKKGKIVLLDTREKKEYEISHIPGAIWVGYDDFDLSRVEGIDKDAEIVTYCSVGYRSERIGEKLQDAKFTNVCNLEGSIFKWINDGNQVEDMDGKTTDRVHGFDKDWGKWVKGVKVVY